MLVSRRRKESKEAPEQPQSEIERLEQTLKSLTAQVGAIQQAEESKRLAAIGELTGQIEQAQAELARLKMTERERQEVENEKRRKEQFESAICTARKPLQKLSAEIEKSDDEVAAAIESLAQAIGRRSTLGEDYQSLYTKTHRELGALAATKDELQQALGDLKPPQSDTYFVRKKSPHGEFHQSIEDVLRYGAKGIGSSTERSPYKRVMILLER